MYHIVGDPGDDLDYLDDDALLDTETRHDLAEAACSVPFEFAYELDIEWNSLRYGVCS